MQTCSSGGGCEGGRWGVGERVHVRCEEKTEDPRTRNAGFQFLFNQKALISFGINWVLGERSLENKNVYGF